MEEELVKETLSSFIKKLQDLYDKHGDLPLAYYDDIGYRFCFVGPEQMYVPKDDIGEDFFLVYNIEDLYELGGYSVEEAIKVICII